MATITWSIAQLDRDAATGGVNIAHWTVSAVDGEHSAYSYGSAGFSPDPENSQFIPYAQLTEATVLDWVWNTLDKAAIESALEQEIEMKKNPVTAHGLPW